MAEPSLGYAIGLNVKRQDIFAPAAKQLSQNLANWKAEKAQAKKEKEAQASKFMTDIMKYSPDELHMKARPDATKFYNGKVAKLESMLENPDVSSMDLLKLLNETSNGMASFKDQSKGFQDTDEKIKTDAASIPSPIKSFARTPDLLPTLDQRAAFDIYGAQYDEKTNRLLSTGDKMFDVRAEIAAPTSEAMLAVASGKDLQKNQQIVKVKTGYDPIAFTKLLPGEKQYILSLANVMDKPGALGSITEEIINKKFSGDDKKYYEFLNAEMKKQYNKAALMTDENAPKDQQPQVPTVQDTARAVATQYMLETHYPLYEAANTKVINLNKEATPGKTSNDKNERPSPSEIADEPQITQKAINALEAAGLTMSVEEAYAIYDGSKPTDPETKNKVNKALNNNIYGSMPTIAFQPGTGEVISLGREQVNPRKMFYDTRQKKFYIIYDQAVAVGGYTEPLTNQVREIQPSEMKQLRRKLSKELAIWDALAPGRKIPTTEAYQSGGRSATSSTVSTSSAPTGGKKKKVF
jgi:hypothetical protein